jgi:transcriptional antiterminator RfaH
METTVETGDWFCVRSQPKHEHIAAAHLRRIAGVREVFSPQLRVRRGTKRGAVWFLEALFPGYLFCRFAPDYELKGVATVSGVKGLVSFGEEIPCVAAEVIAELRRDFDEEEIFEVGDEFQPGAEVSVTAGPLMGFDAKVIAVMPAAQRVKVLLDFLGREMQAELPCDAVVLNDNAIQKALMK